MQNIVYMDDSFLLVITIAGALPIMQIEEKERREGGGPKFGGNSANVITSRGLP